MNQFFIRITHSGLKDGFEPQQTVDAITSLHANFFITCDEQLGSRNAHSHMYLDTDSDETKVRNTIRKYVNSGNKYYSMVAAIQEDVDEERKDNYVLKLIAYCLKTTNYDHAGFPDEIIDLAHAYDDGVKADLKSKKEKKTAARKMMDICKLIDEFVEHQRVRFSKCKMEYKHIMQNDIIDIVIRYHKTSDLSFSVSGLTIMVNKLSLKYIPDYETHLAALILKNLRL